MPSERARSTPRTDFRCFDRASSGRNKEYKMASIASRSYVLSSTRVDGTFSRARFRFLSGARVDIDFGKRRRWLGVFAAAIGTCGSALYFLDESVKAAEKAIPMPRYPWDFAGPLASLDHSSVRRGWQVYRSVCSTCHGLRYVRFLDLVGVSHTQEEVKTIAAEYEVEDGPDVEGKYFTRPAKLSDLIPSPYPNEAAARAANFGGYPQDLTYIVQARKHGKDYVFSLLTGWTDPPAGIALADGQYFNVYFPGGIVTMPQMLHDGMIEYDDGTPASQSQMAKDVVEFLSWTSSQEHDSRKLMFLKGMGILTILLASLLHINRRNWSHMRSRQIAYVPKSRT